jgi:NAD(P)-dependent dehydrogenase (short-subunit alcohol dehydrogenase family)
MVKRALVVGAAGDIGAAIADTLRAAGWSVAGSDIRAAASWPAGDGWVTADIATAEGRRAICASVDAIDGLVIASGRIFTTAIDAITETEWDDAFAVNARGPFFLVRDCLPRLSEGAAVALVGSVAGRRPSPDNLVYGASKAALHAAALSMAAALAPRGIRVNVVVPGLIDTGLTRLTTENLAALHRRDVAAEEVARRAGIPAGRPGTPGEVADAVEFLLSERSSYTTGALLAVSGGVPIT